MRNLDELSEVDIARLAAYTDMCGSVGIRKKLGKTNCVYSVLIQYTTHKSKIINWIGDILYINPHWYPAGRACIMKLETHKKIITKATTKVTIIIHGIDVYNLILRIYPYTLRKKEEAKIISKFYDNYILYSKCGIPHNSIEIQIAEECYQELRALKQKRRE